MEPDNNQPSNNELQTPSSSQPELTPSNVPPSQTTGGEDPGKALSIAAIIFAFLVPIVGLILGIVAGKKSKEAGYKNGLAKASVILSSVFMVLGLVFAILMFTIGASIFSKCSELGPGEHYVEGVTYTCG